MEKPQLINFIAKVMENSGFKVYKNFKTSHDVIDIYAVLPTTVGDFGVVVACNNFDKNFDVGIDLLKKMEEIANSIKASKVMVVTSAFFSEQATNYALRKNIKLVDRNGLLELARKYQNHEEELDQDEDDDFYDDEYAEVEVIDSDYPEYQYDARDMEYLLKNNGSGPSFSQQNNLYRQIEYERANESFLTKFRRNASSRSKSFNSRAPSLGGRRYPATREPRPSILQAIVPYLGNPIVLIILVVLICYLVSFIIGNVMKSSSAMSGVIELFLALVLSYGFTFFFAQRNRYFIIRGTFVFFVSLIILLILILI